MNRMDALIQQALEEDIGSGDITTQSTIPLHVVLHGVFVSKTRGIVAGLEVVGRVFSLYDQKVHYKPNVLDGAPIRKGMVVATVVGPGRSILSTERVALNFLQRMSGIATQTRALVEAVRETRAKILDTRKTAPGLRVFDKWAVRIGGGQNHRFGLYDMVLIKDNHIAACGTITAAVQAVRQKTRKSIEVEVTTIEELREAVSLHPDRIMLDNMNVRQMREAVRLVDGAVPLEASGHVNSKNIRDIARTGVTYISLGSLTHSVKAIDISLEIRNE